MAASLSEIRWHTNGVCVSEYHLRSVLVPQTKARQLPHKLSVSHHSKTWLEDLLLATSAKTNPNESRDNVDAVCSRKTPTSSSPASFPAMLIHVKWLHMVTFCFSCQRLCCSQENFSISFWWSAWLRRFFVFFFLRWPNFLTVFT